MALTLAHIDGNCGNFITGNQFDKFEVRNGSEVVATLIATYDEGKTVIECLEINQAIATGIANEVHLIGCVTMTIVRAFADNHSFYCDVFTDEDGNAIELELFDPLTV